MSSVVDTSVFKRNKKQPKASDDVADKILEGQGPEGSWEWPRSGQTDPRRPLLRP